MERSINQQELERFEQYVFHRMSVSERNDFEADLANNAELKAKFEQLYPLVEGIQRSSFKKDILADLHRETQQQSRTTERKLFNGNNWLWLAAACFAILLVAVFFNFPTKEERLFAKHFEPDPGLPTVMSTTGNYDFYYGMVDYKLGNYEKAISKWDSLQVIDPKNDTLNYFLGAAYLAKKQASKAIPYLQLVSESENKFQQYSYYYLALAYLKEGEIERAKQALQKSNLEEADRLQEDLE